MESIFPAMYSTLSPAALASLVSEKYNIGSVECQFLVRGVGDTYLVGDSRYVLRVYRGSQRSLEQVQAEMELLMASRQADVPVSYPIADREGGLIQTLDAVEGTRYAVLFTYAPGSPAAVLTEQQLQLLGRQMARFHNVSSTIRLSATRWNFDMETTIDRPLAMVENAFASDPEAYAWLQSTATRVKERLASMDSRAFSSGYCHYDFLPKNFHFDGEETLTFFDFDFFGYGWLVNDIMTFWEHLCLDVHFGRMEQEAADRAFAVFVAAYREVRSLSDAELAAVPYLSFGWWLFYMGFYTTHDQFFPFLQPAMLKLRTGLMRRLMERYISD